MIDKNHQYKVHNSGQVSILPNILVPMLDQPREERRKQILDKISELFVFLFHNINKANVDHLEHYIHILLSYIREIESIYFCALFCKFVLHIRDIHNGKGFCDSTYKLIYILHHYYPLFAMYVLRELVCPYYNKVYNYNNEKYTMKIVTVGSWKDMKKMCDVVYKKTNDENHPLILYCCSLLLIQLDNDIQSIKKKKNISLVAKWFPREKSKYKWLFYKLANIFYDMHFTKSKINQTQKYKKLRKVISSLNKQLHTIEIYQCSNYWNCIKMNLFTGNSLLKYKSAFFMNNNKLTTKKYDKFLYVLKDRASCLKKFYIFLRRANIVPQIYKIKSNTLSVMQIIRNIFNNKKSNDEYKNEVNLEYLNALWREKIKLTLGDKEYIGKYVIFCDLGINNSCNNYKGLFNALGLGITLAQMVHPIYRDRLLTFSSYPSWMKFHNYETLIEKLTYVCNHSNWNMDSNFYKAFQYYLEMVLSKNITPKTFFETGIIIISDFNVNSASSKNIQTLYKNMVDMIRHSGLYSNNMKNIKTPELIFWNINETPKSNTGMHFNNVNCNNLALFSGDDLNQLKYILNNIPSKFSRKQNKELSNVIPGLTSSILMKSLPTPHCKTKSKREIEKKNRDIYTTIRNPYFQVLETLHKKHYYRIESIIMNNLMNME